MGKVAEWSKFLSLMKVFREPGGGEVAKSIRPIFHFREDGGELNGKNGEEIAQKLSVLNPRLLEAQPVAHCI